MISQQEIDRNEFELEAQRQKLEELYKQYFYDLALEHCKESNEVSISSIQRKFYIGYRLASWVVAQLEDCGAVSRCDREGKRSVIINGG